MVLSFLEQKYVTLNILKKRFILTHRFIPYGSSLQHRVAGVHATRKDTQAVKPGGRETRKDEEAGAHPAFCAL